MLISIVLFATVTLPPALSLKCYHCSHPSRRISPDLWIHKTLTCARRRPVQCSPRAVACVVVRVNHSMVHFAASGCSEDRVVGCDRHPLPSMNGTMERCQCTTDLCNKDLHLANMHAMDYGGAHAIASTTNGTIQVRLLTKVVESTKPPRVRHRNRSRYRKKDQTAPIPTTTAIPRTPAAIIVKAKILTSAANSRICLRLTWLLAFLSGGLTLSKSLGL